VPRPVSKNSAKSLDLARECLRLSEAYVGSRGVWETLSHRILGRLLGVENKERLTRALAKLEMAMNKRKLGRELRKLSAR
jgi:hypothetical protein